jgi:asparagine synthase (glutamine-hydrolysing)
MMSDVPIGCLLSGGLDSSVITAMVVREWVAKGGEAKDIRTFSIAMGGGTDIEYAEEVARFLGTTHTT